MTDESLPLEFGDHRQRFFDRRLSRRFHHSSYPEVDDIQRIESKIPKIIVHGIDQYLSGKA